MIAVVFLYFCQLKVLLKCIQYKKKKRFKIIKYNYKLDYWNKKKSSLLFQTCFYGMQVYFYSYSGIKKKIRPSGVLGIDNETDAIQTLNIKTEFSLRQIISLDEKNQILTTSFYM